MMPNKNTNRNKYMAPTFYSQPENQFWRDPNHRPSLTERAVERLNALVAELEAKNKIK